MGNLVRVGEGQENKLSAGRLLLRRHLFKPLIVRPENQGELENCVLRDTLGTPHYRLCVPYRQPVGTVGV